MARRDRQPHADQRQWVGASFAVLAAMVYAVRIDIPRASRWFYVYYPAHLAVLLVLGFRIPSQP